MDLTRVDGALKGCIASIVLRLDFGTEFNQRLEVCQVSTLNHQGGHAIVSVSFKTRL